MPLHKTPDGLPGGYQPGSHPGHWQHHHAALPAGRPGDFTPIRHDGTAEEHLSPIGELVDHVLDTVLGDPRPRADREAE